MAPASPAKKSAGLPWRSDGGRRDSFGDGPAGRGPVLDPPDDDKARDKHVEPKRGVLSDAGSIPAASTFDNNCSPLWRKRPPNAVKRPNVFSIQDGARCRPASPSRPAASGSPRWSKASRSTHACSSTPRPCRPRETLRLRRQATLCARTPLRAYRGEYCRLERPIAEVSGAPATVIDELWRPIATEQLALAKAGAPPRHRLQELPGVSRRSLALLGPLDSLLVDG